jgi:hypothetical protein
MGTIEDHQLALCGRVNVGAPKEIVIRFFPRWLLERVDPRALRVERAENVTDGTIFTRGIHPLKHDEQRTLVLRVQEILQIAEPEIVTLHLDGRRGLVSVFSRKVRVDLGERYHAPGANLEELAIAHGLI